MLKKIFFSVFLLCNFLLYAENNIYLDYFKKVNQAELHIAKSDYKGALEIYKALFDAYPHSFYKDVHNAAICAIETKQYKDALQLSKDLVLHGYELKDFDCSGFNALKNSKKQWKQFLSDYPKLRAQYEKTLDLPLREQYLTLFRIDQKAAGNYNNVRDMDSVFYRLATSVSNLIQKRSFQHWMTKKDTINFKLLAMLRHYCGLENRIKASEAMQKDSLYINMKKNDIRILVNQALVDGLLLPEHYVAITTYSDSTNPYGETAIEIDYDSETIRPFLPIPIEKIEEVNQRRVSIGLPPVNDLTQGMINATWYKEYPFKKIKEAWLACDTCITMRDYLFVAKKIELEVKNNYEYDKGCLIIQNMTKITNIYLKGGREYQKNLIPRKKE
ncbi:MAG: hypothetical protein LBT04_03390 [Prevotellaceae bacterium]|jgi:hypothetical protein|nr:hypothetical protein [Prevotellaceae bacterium]